MGKKLVTAGLLAAGALGYRPAADAIDQASTKAAEYVQVMNQDKVVNAAKKFCASPPPEELHRVEKYPDETQGVLNVDAKGGYTDRALARLKGAHTHTEFVASCKNDGNIVVQSTDGPGSHNMVGGLRLNMHKLPERLVEYKISKDGEVTRGLYNPGRISVISR